MHGCRPKTYFFVPVCSNVQNLIKVGVGIIYHLRGFAVLLEENC